MKSRDDEKKCCGNCISLQPTNIDNDLTATDEYLKYFCDMYKKIRLPEDDRFCQYWSKKQDL